MTWVAVVTGAARGIGVAAVFGLAARGLGGAGGGPVADDPALPDLLDSQSELDQVVAGHQRERAIPRRYQRSPPTSVTWWRWLRPPRRPSGSGMGLTPP